MGAPHYTPTGKPIQGAQGASQDLRAEFGLVETGMQVMNAFPLNLWFVDGNTADTTFIVVPWDCLVTSIYVVVGQNGNATTDTILTPKINSIAITGGGLTIPLTASAGDVIVATPTAANAISAGQVLEVATDGGGSTVMALTISALLERT